MGQGAETPDGQQPCPAGPLEDGKAVVSIRTVSGYLSTLSGRTARWPSTGRGARAPAAIVLALPPVLGSRELAVAPDDSLRIV